MTVYMKITRDKYELPEAVADSIIELARMCGVSWRTIDGALYRNKRPKGRPKYIAVKLMKKIKKMIDIWMVLW